MSGLIRLCGRGLRYVRQYGPAQLYYKVRERRKREQAEAGYTEWLYGQLPGQEEEKRQSETVFPENPLISVLVPAYETPEIYLRQMIESVLSQSYGNLELCIADGSSGDRVFKVAEEYSRSDKRLRYQRLSGNHGISVNTNAALAMASGDYAGLLDHDDILLPGALFEIVRAINEAGGADALYTDEDKLDSEKNLHFQPHFKPDFNHEYLLSNNYICHFFVVKRELARRVGGFRSEFDGAQDYDFILRCVEKAQTVLHIPRVLYSWRCHDASTAVNPESKLYAYEAGKRAVAAHLKRTGVPGRVFNTSNYGFYRVRFGKETKAASGGGLENLDRQSHVKVVYYDKVCNKSVIFPKTIKKEDGEAYVLFTSMRRGRLSDGFLEELVSSCSRPEVGIACARVYGRDMRLSSEVCMSGVRDPFGTGTRGLKKGYTGYFHRAVLQQEITEPTDCFLVKSRFLQGAKELTVKEICETVRKQGCCIVYDPWAVVYGGR